jgi:type I restriction enzyme S subunit
MNEVPFEELFLQPSRNGVSVPKSARGTGTLMVNMGELFAQARIRSSLQARVPLAKTADRQKFLLQEGDLLFARRSLTVEGAGHCSIVAGSDEPRTWESSIIQVRLDETRADSRYYYYYFRSPSGRQRIETIVEQVAAAGIRNSDLRRLLVPVPPLPEQYAVAEVLGALDDKIECNSLLARLLEGRLAVLFTALSFDVPEGDLVELNELVELNPQTPKARATVAPYIDMAALPTGSALVAAPSTRPPKSGTRFVNGDTVMARITPCLENGKAAYIDCLAEGEVGMGSTEFLVLRPRNELPAAQFAYFLARSPRFRDFAVRHMSGSSGRQRCPADVLARYELCRPTSDALAKFSAQAVSSFTRMRAALNESLVLAQLRDFLLPRLLSGELRVREALVEGPA